MIGTYSFFATSAVALVIASPARAEGDAGRGIVYIGAQAGWQNIDDHFHGYWKTTPPIAWDLGQHGGNGLVGGIHAGYERPAGPVYIGLEADFEGTPASVEDTQNGWRWMVKNRWQTSLRARAGVQLGAIRAYATGGLAVAKVDHNYLNIAIAQGESFRVTKTKVGYIVGGGLEHRLSDRLTVRIEYRNSDYGNVTAEANPAWKDVQMHRLSIQGSEIGVSYRL